MKNFFYFTDSHRNLFVSDNYYNLCSKNAIQKNHKTSTIFIIQEEISQLRQVKTS